MSLSSISQPPPKNNSPPKRSPSESPNLSSRNLTSLASLRERVQLHADLNLPDFTYGDEGALTFKKLDISEDDPEYVGLEIENPGDPDNKLPFLFSKWSRAQLLSRLGASEKWFRDVAASTQVEELNTRLHCLEEMKVRTCRGVSEDAFPYRMVRGMVSKMYTDIPNTSIMEALTEAAKDSYAVRSLSGITDRAFYAYVVIDSPLTIPNTSFRALPGVVVRNSEVGYTSLSLTPFMFKEDYGTVAILHKSTLLRKIHRGKVNKMEVLFKDALVSASRLWASIDTKLDTLFSTQFADAATALHRMAVLLQKAGATKAFVRKCESTYKQANPTRHSALTVFEAILASLEHIHEDDAFDQGTIAGAVLAALVF